MGGFTWKKGLRANSIMMLVPLVISVFRGQSLCGDGLKLSIGALTVGEMDGWMWNLLPALYMHVEQKKRIVADK